ncbi:hypothetical protein D1007_26714 [Hordeum vulgare]|nr:hypothetical protein D1007_26714 [Hordeum vulgare]
MHGAVDVKHARSGLLPSATRAAGCLAGAKDGSHAGHRPPVPSIPSAPSWSHEPSRSREQLHPRLGNNRDVMHDDRWLHDLAQGLEEWMEKELSHLASLLDSVLLVEGTSDRIVWRFTPSQEYSTRSANLPQFMGSIQPKAVRMLWSGWPPEKCGFFLWMAILGRIPTADLLLR